MNSFANMDMARVVPDAGKVVGRAVEDDRAAHQHEALDVLLDRSELVRDVDDRHAQLAVEIGEELGERLLRLGVDAGRRLVEDQEGGLARERLRDEGSLLHPAGERANGHVRDRLEADAGDRIRDELAIVPAERADEPPDASRPADTTSRTVAGASPPASERCAR